MTTQTAFCHPTSDVSSPAREPFAIIPLSIVRALSGTCTRSAVLIYCALAAHADREGHCWPGRTRLGDIAGLSERQVSRATAELERKGLLRKESLSGSRVDYYLTPLTSETAPPDTRVTPPLTAVTPRTDQGTDQKKTERAREPEPPSPPPDPSPPLSECRLQTRTPLPADWQLPDDWWEWATSQRPDLVGKIDAVASNFFDYHASKSTRSACWIAEWRRWIRRERVSQTSKGSSQDSRPASRYPKPDAAQQPLPEAIQRALQLTERRRREQLLQAGIDPDTGVRVIGMAGGEASLQGSP